VSTHRRGHQGLLWIRLSAVLAFALLSSPVFAAQLSLSWSDNATNESGSRIERRLNPVGSYSEIATVGSNVTTYSDTTVTAGLGYCYRVRAYNSVGNSGYSNEACTTAAIPPPSGGLVAAYSFNEGSGSTVGDASGQGNTGTVSGATWTNQGRFGNALVFDGVNDWVTVPHSGSLGLTTGMTVMAWVYPTTTSGKRDVLIKEGTAVDIYNLYAQNGLGFPESNVFVGGVNQIAQGSALPANTWTHLASTYDGTTLKLFVNGSQAASTPVPGAIAASTGALRIGGNSLWGEFFQGRIDEVRVYSRALSASEIGNGLNTAIGGGSPPPPPPPSVTLTVTKSGTGTVTSTSPATAINCGADCTETVPSGTLITLAAVPGSGFAFTGWSGGGCSGVGGCTTTLLANTTVTATFASSTSTLTVTKAGSGTGTVAGPGIACGTDCSQSVPSGTAVALTATPAADSTFGGWSGGGCSGVGGCTTTLLANTTVTATFTSSSSSTLTVTKAGSGTGTVAGPGIACGTDCSESIPSGTAVALTATPAADSTFGGWSGACGGMGGCTVTVSATTVVGATFDSTPPSSVVEIVTGAEPGSVPRVRGLTRAGVPTTTDFLAYASSFTGGVFVALGNLGSPGSPLIVTGSGPGIRAEVRAFHIDGSSAGASFYPYGSFSGGARIAVCDVDGDGTDEIISVPGPGNRPLVAVWRLGSQKTTKLFSFSAGLSSNTRGLFVACGDFDGDGASEIAVGYDQGGTPEVRVYRVVGTKVTLITSFLAYEPSFKGGVRVTTADVDGDGLAEIITAPGPGGDPVVRAFRVAFDGEDPDFTGGLFVAGGQRNPLGGVAVMTSPGPGGPPHVRIFSVSPTAVTESTSVMLGQPGVLRGVTLGASQ